MSKNQYTEEQVKQFAVQQNNWLVYLLQTKNIAVETNQGWQKFELPNNGGKFALQGDTDCLKLAGNQWVNATRETLVEAIAPSQKLGVTGSPPKVTAITNVLGNNSSKQSSTGVVNSNNAPSNDSKPLSRMEQIKQLMLNAKTCEQKSNQLQEEINTSQQKINTSKQKIIESKGRVNILEQKEIKLVSELEGILGFKDKQFSHRLKEEYRKNYGTNVSGHEIN